MSSTEKFRYFHNTAADLADGAHVELNKEQWQGVINKYIQDIIHGQPPTVENCRGAVYLGCSGIAYMLYYVSLSPLMAIHKQDMQTQAYKYADVALNHAKTSSRDPPGSFLVGPAGTYAVASLVYAAQGKDQQSSELRAQYRNIAGIYHQVEAVNGGSDELFVGRAGYLCGALLLERAFNKTHSPDSAIIPYDSIAAICNATILSGREYAKRNKSPCPLMYAYYQAECLGAGHGLSAILQMLLSFPEYLKSDPSAEHDIRVTVDYMLTLMQPNGNFGQLLGEKPRAEEDELVHWCHGAPGVVYMFAKAFLYWKDDKYLQACLKCGELTWQKGLLYKGPGICHGVAGSGYVFLLLYRLTSDERHLHRALKFAEFLLTEEFQSGARRPDFPYSLYEGTAGTVCFLLDLLQPNNAEFPFFDVFYSYDKVLMI